MSRTPLKPPNPKSVTWYKIVRMFSYFRDVMFRAIIRVELRNGQIELENELKCVLGVNGAFSKDTHYILRVLDLTYFFQLSRSNCVKSADCQKWRHVLYPLEL